MNTIRVRIFFFLLIITSSVFSQDKLYDFVDSNIAALKQQKVDPIIVIGPEQYPMIIVGIELSNHRQLGIWESYYYFYQLANETFLIKCIEAYDENDPHMILKSKPIKIKNDSLFQWLSFNDSLISRESVLPFIYQDTVKGIPFYNNALRMHAFPYSIEISHINKSRSFTFERIAMQLHIIEEDPSSNQNLNYLFNSQTSIFKLYYKIEKILKLHHDLFKFE